MKNILIAAMFASTIAACAQDVQLPAPDPNRKSDSVVETLRERHSVREYAETPLTLQELGDLCWAACGVSRDSEHRTAPSAMNRKEIRLFVFTKDGVFEYDAPAHALKSKAEGDHRTLIAGSPNGHRQEFAATAPVSLLLVIDFERFGSSDEQAVRMGCVDAGNVSENINLYCQAVGLATVPRATHDAEGIRKLLGFTEKQLPILNNPVGHPKE